MRFCWVFFLQFLPKNIFWTQVLGAKAPKKQRTVADDAAEILEASHYQEYTPLQVAVVWLTIQTCWKSDEKAAEKPPRTY